MKIATNSSVIVRPHHPHANSGYTHLKAFTCSVRPERSGPVSSRRPTVARRLTQSKGGPLGSNTPSSVRTRESFIRIRGPHKASHNCHEKAVQVSTSSRPRHPREGGDPRPRLLAKSRLVGQRTPFSSSYVAQGPWAIPVQGDLCIAPSPLEGEGWDGRGRVARQAGARYAPALDSGFRWDD